MLKEIIQAEGKSYYIKPENSGEKMKSFESYNKIEYIKIRKMQLKNSIFEDLQLQMLELETKKRLEFNYIKFKRREN